MQKRNSLITVCVLVLVTSIGLVSSCKKENTNSQQSSTLKYIDAFLTENQPLAQQYSISTGEGSSIVGQEGTRFEFPKNAFVSANGTPITGNVDFELQEIYSAGAMISMDMPTVSSGNILVSGGEFAMSARQNGVDLLLAPGKSIQVKTPTTSLDSSMELFVGSEQNGSFDWTQEANTEITPTIDSNTAYYAFGLINMYRQVNCDYLWGDPRPRTYVDIKLPTGHSPLNTKVYIYISSISSIVPVTNWNSNLGQFEIDGGYAQPVGQSVQFVGIHHTGINMQYSLQEVDIVKDHVEVLSFQDATFEELADVLNSL